MTVLEVVAGLAIAGSVLTALLVAKGRYERQWVRAQHRLAAVEAADQLLSGWHQDLASFPRSGSGSTEDRARRLLHWRTEEVSRPRVGEERASVIRLTIHDGTNRLGAPLVSVDVLLPAESEGRHAN